CVRHQRKSACVDDRRRVGRARRHRGRLPRALVHADPVVDLCVGRRRVRRRHARRVGIGARSAVRRRGHRRFGSHHDGRRVAVVGADRIVHAADRVAAPPAGPNLKLDRAIVAIVAGGFALATIPFLPLPAFYASFLYLVLHWVVLATSWNILSGYSGYFSFGHGAFYGAGVY